MMKHLMVVALGLTLVSSPAFAATAAKHCVGKDGTEISLAGAKGKTPSAQCKAAGGKWLKMKKASTAPKK
jgi:hypothetical protein